MMSYNSWHDWETKFQKCLLFLSKPEVTFTNRIKHANGEDRHGHSHGNKYNRIKYHE